MDLVATVGEQAYLTFATYFLNENLPVPSGIVADPKIAFTWEKLTADQIYAIFAGVSSLVPDKRENLVENLFAITEVYIEAARHLSPDGVAVCCGLLESLFL